MWLGRLLAGHPTHAEAVLTPHASYDTNSLPLCAPPAVPGVEAEAELLAAIVTFFQRLGLGAADVGLKVSSRKVLQAVLQRYGVAEASFGPVCVVVDKMEKIPRDKVGGRREAAWAACCCCGLLKMLPACGVWRWGCSRLVSGRRAHKQKSQPGPAAWLSPHPGLLPVLQVVEELAKLGVAADAIDGILQVSWCRPGAGAAACLEPACVLGLPC